MKRANRLALALGTVVAALGVITAISQSQNPPGDTDLQSGWGVDACLTCHVPLEELPAYLESVREGQLTYLRERGPEHKVGLRKLRAADYEPVVFSTPIGEFSPQHPWDQLPTNLLEVYRGGRELTQQMGGIVRVWEMVGEPDVHFCRDLPGRVVAYQKALYLGMRDGARKWGPDREPIILMGALGMFPGPWLERASRNGLFDYTDGLNFHYYGHARDFRSAVIAQRAFAAKHSGQRTLPIWITECGMNSVPGDDFNEARGREIQRAFTVETATVAREEGVSVFMPFILAHQGDTYALLRGVADPYPAWSAYAELTSRESLPAGPAAARPAAPNRLIVQWLPDNWTCIPHKVSGADWFRGRFDDPRPMKGNWVVTNVSDAPVVGILTLKSEPGVTIRSPDGNDWQPIPIRIPAMGARAIPVSLIATPDEFVHARVQAAFQPTQERPGVARSNAEAIFATRPSTRSLPEATPIKVSRPSGDDYDWIWSPETPADRSESGPWIGLNGVTILGKNSPETGTLSTSSCFDVHNDGIDPRLPPMAVTRVNGLPGGATSFLRLRFGPRSDFVGGVRVDLIDDLGQRFTVGENLGKNRYHPARSSIHLAFADFHPYAFARLTTDPVFRPEAVRQIQLRFYGRPEGTKFCVKLEIASPGG